MSVAHETAKTSPAPQGRSGFFAAQYWPLATILVYVGFSVAAFAPRLFDYLATGGWGLSATRAFEFAPGALTVHALFGIALVPFLFVQPVLGAMASRRGASAGVKRAHRWQGWALVLSAALLSTLGFYITYVFSANSDSITSVIFMFLVALFVIVFFAEAIWQARKGRVDRHLDALVFGMIFLSVPATGRLIEAAMRSSGVENTRSRDVVSIGPYVQVELVDITILLISAAPILLWAIYAVPRRVFGADPIKAAIASAFFVLPLGAVVAQAVSR